jgi:hypothetical protein
MIAEAPVALTIEHPPTHLLAKLRAHDTQGTSALLQRVIIYVGDESWWLSRLYAEQPRSATPAKPQSAKPQSEPKPVQDAETLAASNKALANAVKELTANNKALSRSVESLTERCKALADTNGALVRLFRIRNETATAAASTSLPAAAVVTPVSATPSPPSPVFKPLRNDPSRYDDRARPNDRTKPCFAWQSKGHCRYGDLCRYVHVSLNKIPFADDYEEEEGEEKDYDDDDEEEEEDEEGEEEDDDDAVDEEEETPTKVCFAYRRTGSCRYGNRCYYSHIV